MNSKVLCLLCAAAMVMTGCVSGSNRDLSSEGDYGIEMTNLIDMRTGNDELISGYGLTFYVLTPHMTILMDTGDYAVSDPDQQVLNNMNELNLKVEDIDLIFISHWHKGKGLRGIHEANPDVEVYAPLEDSDSVKYKYGEHEYNLVSEEWISLGPDIYSTGSLRDPGRGIYEQALVLDMPEGLIVIVSCGHPGIIEMVASVREIFPRKEIALLLGGFHLSDTDTDLLPQILDDLISLGVRKIAPSHCSGENFEALARERLGANFIEGKAGLTLSF